MSPLPPLPTLAVGRRCMTKADFGTLVMGAAVGYTEAQIGPFLVSLRKAGYQGDVALIVEPQVVEHFRGLSLFEGVTFLPASQWLPLKWQLLRRRYWIGQVLLWHPAQTLLWVLVRVMSWLPLPRVAGLRLQIQLVQHIYPPTETRYLHYFRFLERTSYSRILLTDVRDVLFQSDPFTDLPRSGLAVSIETSRHTMASEERNAEWVRLIYGPEVLRQIANRPVSCSGVTYGDRDSILQYLEQMAHGVIGLSLRAARKGFFDQGIHNVLLWTRQLGDFHSLETLKSPVATLSGVDEAQLRLSPEGKLLNSDGSIVSVIHQYDRLPGLKAVLLRPLASPIR